MTKRLCLCGEGNLGRTLLTHNQYLEQLDAVQEALEDDPEQVLRVLAKWAKLTSSDLAFLCEG